MTKKQNDKIYIPELQIYLDRESFFITTIFDNKTEYKKIRRRNATISGIFRLTVNRLWVYEEEPVVKYYFNYGDKNNSFSKSNFDKNELIQEWNRIMKEIVKDETKPKKTKKE